MKMRLNTFAVLLSTAAISAAPVPKPQAFVPAPLALQSPAVHNNATAEGLLNGLGLGNLPVVGPVLTPVLNVVDGLVDALKGALPAEFVKQLKTGLGPALGPIEKLPLVGSIVASLLGVDPVKANWNATALDGDQSQILAHLATTRAPPSSLAAAGHSTAASTPGAAPTSVAAVPSDTASPPLHHFRPCEPLDPEHPTYPVVDELGNLTCPIIAPSSPYDPNAPLVAPAHG